MHNPNIKYYLMFLPTTLLLKKIIQSLNLHGWEKYSTHLENMEMNLSL